MSTARIIAATLTLALGLIAPSTVTIAGFTRAQLANLAASPSPNATLPVDATFRDENDRPITIGNAIGGVPAIVVFADYTCRTLCGPIVEFVAGAISKTGFAAGRDYRLVVIGLNSRNTIANARAMRADHIYVASIVGNAAVFLTGTQDAIDSATAAAGLHYAYDAEHDQYAHPAAAYIVDSQAHIRRVLSPLGLDGSDLRLALVEAGHGAIGSIADRIHLLCYGYDPIRGVYTERITSLLALSAGVTLVLVLGGVSLLVARERRKAAA
jgi:protein SCO1